MPGVLDSFRLDGRVACVTGTTRGIGRTAAIALAEAGCDIVHLDRRDPAETRAEIEAWAVAARSSSSTSRRRTPPRANARSKPPPPPSAASTSSSTRPASSRAARALDVSGGGRAARPARRLVCVLALARAAGRVFVAQGSGAIVNVASLLTFQGGVLVSELRDRQARRARPDARARERVGAARRPRQRHRPRLHRDRLQPAPARRPVRYKEMLDRIPAGRWGTPDDLAARSSTSARPPART